MASKKSNIKKAAPKKAKTALTKIAETIGTVAGEIAVKKEQIAGMASNAINAVKSKIHEATAPETKGTKTTIKMVSKKVNSSNTIKVAKNKADEKLVQPAKKIAYDAKKSVKKATSETTEKTGSAGKAAAKTVKKAIKK